MGGRNCLQPSDILAHRRISVKITVSWVVTSSRLIACYQRPSSAPKMEAAAHISYGENLNSYLGERVVQKSEYWCKRDPGFINSGDRLEGI